MFVVNSAIAYLKLTKEKIINHRLESLCELKTDAITFLLRRTNVFLVVYFATETTS